MADINSYFQERRNQFHKNVYAKHWRANPFRGLVPMSAFDLTEGRTPTVRTLTHELPTAYPSALTEVTVSNGTGNPACNPAATTIKRGEIQRTFKLYQASFQTDEVCLSDLKRAEHAAQAVADFERSLTDYINVWWGDYYRLQNISMVSNHATTNGATSLGVTSGSVATDLTDVAALPTHDLNWDHLEQVYWDLVRNGLADELAVGRDSKGMPVLPLHASPGIISRLFTDDSVKSEVKYFDPKSNLALLGYNGAVKGFLPVVDLFPVRFGDADGIASVAELTIAKTVYPTVNGDATVGRKNLPNAYYKALAKGGRAEYEVVTILGRQVYETQYEAVNPTSFAGMTFATPKSYVGEFQWVNQRTYKGDNDRGNLGYYLADIRVAAKPIFPELGYSILTKVPLI